MSHYHRLHGGLFGVLAASILATAATPALACTLDNRPSLSANGVLVVTNRQVPLNSAQLAAFAPFVFPRRFSAGHAILFSENKQDVARSLRADAMRRPWRWRFAGSTSYGWTVKHTFSRKGTYRILVDAYYPGTRQWYEFDRVQISIG